MSENFVTIKGDRAGLYIDIKEGKFDIIKAQLQSKLFNAKDFLKGGKVVNFKGMKLSGIEKDELRSIIEDEYGINVSYENLSDTDEVSKFNNKVFEGIDEGKTKFIRTTVRSGQIIQYDGNIVILGDVNPGANIIATGNIIVQGRLRGVAHAGSNGNRNAIISAFKLQSKQVRIADIISRCPDDDFLIQWPEIAMIKDNIIVIEPYLRKNIK